MQINGFFGPESSYQTYSGPDRNPNTVEVLSSIEVLIGGKASLFSEEVKQPRCKSDLHCRSLVSGLASQLLHPNHGDVELAISSVASEGDVQYLSASKDILMASCEYFRASIAPSCLLIAKGSAVDGL